MNHKLKFAPTSLNSKFYGCIKRIHMYQTLEDTITEVHIEKRKSTFNPIDDKWHLEWIKIQRPDNPDVIFHYNDWIKNEKIFIA